MAPELCNETEYTNKVDVWAIGIITYVLLSGKAPFTGRKKADIYDKINRAEPWYSHIAPASADAKEFIKACIRKNPEERPTMAELLEMKWLKDFRTGSTLSEATQLNISANLFSFRKTTTFQSGVCSIIANL